MNYFDRYRFFFKSSAIHTHSDERVLQFQKADAAIRILIQSSLYRIPEKMRCLDAFTTPKAVAPIPPPPSRWPPSVCLILEVAPRPVYLPLTRINDIGRGRGGIPLLKAGGGRWFLGTPPSPLVWGSTSGHFFYPAANF